MSAIDLNQINNRKNVVTSQSENKMEPDNIFKLSQLSGRWDNGAEWRFYSAKDIPIFDPVTAVFCVALTPGGIILTETHRRVKELLGGHVEQNETIQDTLMRESFEEGGIILENWVQLGCRQISMDKEVINKSTGMPYPIRAYIPYFLAYSEQPLQLPSGQEVVSREVISIQEALKLDLRLFPERREFEMMIRQCIDHTQIVAADDFSNITVEDIRRAMLKMISPEINL